MNYGKDGKPIIGTKGIKYGLQKAPGLLGRKAPAKKPLAKKPLAMFGGDDSDSEHDMEAEIQRHAAKKLRDAKVARMHEEALAEDPNAYAYDEVYDDMKAERAKPMEQDKAERKSKYIQSLLDKSKQRDREQNLISERALAKERAKEDHLYGDKEVFITNAYRKKLEEDKKLLAEQKAEEERQKAFEVGGANDLDAFYANLSSNVAFGGAAKPKPKPKPAPEASPSAADADQDADVAGTSADVEGASADVADDPDAALRERLARDAARKAQAEIATEDEYTQLRRRAEAAAKREPELDGTEAREPKSNAEAKASKSKDRDQRTKAADVAADVAPKPAVAARRNDSDAVSAARARFLARKKARTG